MNIITLKARAFDIILQQAQVAAQHQQLEQQKQELLKQIVDLLKKTQGKTLALHPKTKEIEK